MELSAEEFSRIVHSLGMATSADGPEGQRRAARVSRQAQLSIATIKNGRPETATTVRVKDLSSRGIGFIHDRRLKESSQFVMRMTREELPPIEILCTVVHCAQVSNEIWSVGAEFTCVAPVAATPDDAIERERIRHLMLG
jgi:hypothetical protein